MPRIVLLFLCALLYALPLHPAQARPAPASEMTVTLLTVSEAVLQVQAGDGRALTIPLTRATWVLRRGVVVSIREFTPGETVQVRLGRLKGDTRAAALVCDPETAAALAAAHGHSLSGMLLAVDGALWTIQPEGTDLPLPVCVTPRTVFQAGGGPVDASVYSVGASVTVTTRGLANGLLTAVSVSDTPPEGGTADTPRRPTPLSGVVREARPDLSLLTLEDPAGAMQTLAIGRGTRVKVGGKAASLDQIAPGMHVLARLSAVQDAAGHRVATSVSASAGRRKKGKG